MENEWVRNYSCAEYYIACRRFDAGHSDVWLSFAPLQDNKYMKVTAESEDIKHRNLTMTREL